MYWSIELTGTFYSQSSRCSSNAQVILSTVNQLGKLADTMQQLGQ